MKFSSILEILIFKTDLKFELDQSNETIKAKLQQALLGRRQFGISKIEGKYINNKLNIYYYSELNGIAPGLKIKGTLTSDDKKEKIFVNLSIISFARFIMLSMLILCLVLYFFGFFEFFSYSVNMIFLFAILGIYMLIVASFIYDVFSFKKYFAILIHDTEEIS